MTEISNDILVTLECLLIEHETPEYIDVSVQHEFIYIMLAKNEYEHMTVTERIMGIYLLLEILCPYVMETYPVVIECFSIPELSDVFKEYGTITE